jgi:hypothetical protein
MKGGDERGDLGIHPDPKHGTFAEMILTPTKKRVALLHMNHQAAVSPPTSLLAPLMVKFKSDHQPEDVGKRRRRRKRRRMRRIKRLKLRERRSVT